MKHNNKILLVILSAAIVFAISTKNSFSQVTDFDNNSYRTITIGTQEWTAENLNVAHYRNGDEIPQVQDKDKWAKLTTGAWCYYENKTDNGKTYGKLYNWYAVNDPRGLAPEGWHVPTSKEWKELSSTIGEDSFTGGHMKSTTLWSSPNNGGDNSSDFSALPSGTRVVSGGFMNILKYCGFWSASEDGGNFSWVYGLNFNNAGLNRNSIVKGSGFSVRVVKD